MKLYLMVTPANYAPDYHAYTEEDDAVHAAAEFSRENWPKGGMSAYNEDLPEIPPTDDREVIRLGQYHPDNLWYADVVEIDLD